MAKRALIGAEAENLKVESRKQKKGTKSVSGEGGAKRPNVQTSKSPKKAEKTARPSTAHRAVAHPPAEQSAIGNRKSAITASTVETIALERIRPAAYNPRRELKPGDAEFEKLRRSIEQFGLVDPPIWNKRTGNLVGGHQRLAVLRHMHPDLSELAVSVVDLDPAAEKALNVALNKIAGEWDESLLTDLLRDLMMEGDATATGFDQAEIDALLEGVAGHGAGEGADTSPQLGSLEYRVVVDCRNEEHQRTMLERFAKEKLPCRALIS